MWWWLSVARAADPSPGVGLPSAVAVDAGAGEVSITAAHATIDFLGTTEGGGLSLRAGYAPIDRMWVEVAAAGVYSENTSCGLFGGCSETQVSGAGLAGVSFRYNVVQLPQFAMAPVAVGFADPWGELYGFGGGVALEGGSRRVRGDLSAVVIAVVDEGSPAMLPVPVGELGVSFRIGSEYRHQIRVGIVEVLPDVSWRYEADAWFLELGVTGVPLVAGAERVEVGWRF